MSIWRRARESPILVGGTAMLAIVAYVPALLSSPGRMPADSKLYLYLDPGRFLGDAATSFDPRNYAGWVPHQHIGYLWPTGPYYWTLNAIGMPDWVAHRLWIGSLLFIAGTGVWWCARKLGIRIGPALAAGMVYQTSVYVLPYVSRTSVMLLPWCALGWIVGCTVWATSIPPSASWRDRWRPAATIALVIFTVGAVNATALALIAPAPALWLLYAAGVGLTTWTRSARIALRTAVLCVGVSVWWIVMLILQGRYGADVLPFSETLADVSFTSTGVEVWRGLGYWLFYIRDVAGPATTSSLRYLVSSGGLAVSFLIPLIGLAGLSFTDWCHRRFAALLVAVGGVLAVGVHPIEDPSPLMAFVARDADGVGLALRSSTRALPVLMLGLALGAAALVDAVPRRGRLSQRQLALAAVCGIALLNVPTIWQARLVDPALDRDQSPPESWTDAAAAISGPGSENGRVLQVPGVDFGAYRWGYTVDQPLPGLADKPLVTRDLLPLGSAAAMDVAYAYDDRIQSAVLAPGSTEAVAHALGVDTIWLTGDVDYGRFRSARPSDIADTITQSGSVTTFGEPFVDASEYPHIDERSLSIANEPLPTVSLVSLDRPAALVRADTTLTAVSGSGDSIVDSSSVQAAIERSALIYTADRTNAVEGTRALIVTDANRNRNRHWRGSQDTTGATLGADDPVSQLEREQRLGVFDNRDPDTMSVAVQQGPLSAFAALYGEPFSFQPERRAAMAIDDDPNTAWTVGEHSDPIGAAITITPTEPVTSVDLYQYLPLAGQRRISRVRLEWAPDLTISRPGPRTGPDTLTVDLTTTRPGQPDTVELPYAVSSPITLTITEVDGGTPFTAGVVAGVGFTDIVANGHDGPIPPTTEWVRTPIDAIGDVPPGFALAYSLRRERVDPLNHWRSDPEPALRRIIEVPHTDTFNVATTARLDARATDEALADLLGAGAWASSRLTGSLASAGWAAFDGDPSTAWMSEFDTGVGTELHVEPGTGTVDGFTVTQPDADLSRITALEVSDGSATHTVAIEPDDEGAATVRLDPPLDGGSLTITVTAVEPSTTVDRRFGDVRQLPVAISEIDLGIDSLAPNLPIVTECAPILTIDRNPIEASLTIDAGALDAGSLDGGAVTVTPCTETVELTPGSHRVGPSAPASPAASAVVVDTVELTNAAFDEFLTEAAGPTATATESGSSRSRRIEVDGCADGCWVVFGEGYNPGWRATVGDRDLGDPTLLDGTANGWWLPADVTSGGSATVDVVWRPQRGLNLAFAVTAGFVACCLIVLFGRRDRRDRHHDVATAHRPSPPTVRWSWSAGSMTRRSAAIAGAGAMLLSWLVAGPSGLPYGLLVAVLAIVWPSRLVFRAAPIVIVAVVAALTIIIERRDSFPPDAGWPVRFEGLHAPAMVAFGLVLLLAFVDRRDPSAVAGHADE